MTKNNNLGTVSLSNSVWLNIIRKLQTDRAYRDAEKLFYAEGIRNLVQLTCNDFDIAAVICSEKLLTSAIARKQVRTLRQKGVPIISLSPEQFRSLSHTPRASGIGVVAQQRWSRLHTVSPQKSLCWVILEQVRTPGNLGTLIRSSEAIGGSGFILLGNSIDPYTPSIVRASMGALFHQCFIRTNIKTLRHWIRRHRAQVVGASPDGHVNMHQAKYRSPTLLLLGEERKGLTAVQRSLCQNLVQIPMVGQVDSLNLGVAGSLLLYEIYRAKRYRTR
ncbi:MAG: RNA methyltransferase [Chloroflexota bacterium]